VLIGRDPHQWRDASLEAAPRRIVAETAKQLEVERNEAVAYVLKTFHTAHGGKLGRPRLAGQLPTSTLHT
jgi:hypothetical protein